MTVTTGRRDTVLDPGGYAMLPPATKLAVDRFISVAFGEDHTHCARLELTEAGCVATFYARRDGKFYVEDGEVVSYTRVTNMRPPDWRWILVTRPPSL